MISLRNLTLATLILMTGFTTRTPGQPGGKLSDDARAVVQGNNVFASDLYAQLSKKEGNLFFSPYSISTALGMTYAGAKGETEKQMAQTLHFGLTQEKLHPAFAELIKHLNATGDKRPYQLSVANALWGQKNFTFLPGFVKLTNDSYGAGFKEVDFVGATEEARKTINAWVEKETKDKIKELLKPGILTIDTRLVLTNAIYFKSAWETPFPKANTKPGDFTLASGNKVQVPMMQKNDRIAYVDGGTFQAVKLPYKGHALSMVVLLPKKADGIADLEKSLTAAQLAKWIKDMKPHQVDVKLPKFKTTSEFSLKKELSAMGMSIAFVFGQADFSGISTQQKLFIKEVVHKAFVDVHEEGTEAAAATAVIIDTESKPVQLPPATFHADHPFTFAIYENQTGSILFMGRVNNPIE
jgi:serpin B